MGSEKEIKRKKKTEGGEKERKERDTKSERKIMIKMEIEKKRGDRIEGD